ncbi:FKBP-type peptidyl-prolyl cis-trans isomerase [Wolbachia endosymbiont of Pentidionis agamae]|uniref:peptidylprolyl isomerase n=1 Tax=Wolbachia endosymbiont of Pentidionis agamae TaxID=3110435 RepID=UPI002FD17D8D
MKWIRKSILMILSYVLIFLSFCTIFITLVIYGNKNTPKKGVEIFGSGSLAQIIAHNFIKPVIDSAFDRYVKKNGLTEYLNEVKEEDAITFSDITEGYGKKAYCGQKVLLKIHEISGTFLFQNQNSDTIWEIGKSKSKELDSGIIGMKEGGERVIVISTDENGKTNLVSYYVKLIEIKDPYPDSVDNLMIFDNLPSRGKKVKCGDNISIKYNIRKYNGEPTIENQILNFRVGDAQAPLAFQLGVIGMTTSSNRTVISPPDMLTAGGSILIENIDKKNISILEFTLQNERNL